MGKTTLGIIFFIAISATILTVDLLFFRHHTMQRLIANVAIVLVYATIYFIYSKRFD